jgi:putative MFS transporter
MAGAVYYFFGFETKGKSIEEIDRELAATTTPPVTHEVGAKRMA